MAHPYRVYGCGKDVESQNRPLQNPPKINSVSSISASKNSNAYPIEAHFDRGDAVYKANDRGKDGMPRKVKLFVCCAEPFNGVMHYRLKDKPPPSEDYVTDWIAENSLREWTE